MIIQVAYSNSHCSDLWEIFIKQNKKHCKIPLYMIVDKEPESYGQEGSFIYTNDQPYYKVWIDALQKFNSDYFIYLQEDFILYNDVNEEKINEYIEFLKNSTYSFVRLIKSGNVYEKKVGSTLYQIESSNMNVFAMQATIWKTADYIKLLNTTKEPKWLETENYRNKMIALNMMGVYHYDGEERAGKYHNNSKVYPYIATAIGGGKWNTTEYNTQIRKLLPEYNIDINKRGTI